MPSETQIRSMSSILHLKAGNWTNKKERILYKIKSSYGKYFRIRLPLLLITSNPKTIYRSFLSNMPKIREITGIVK